jgi:UDP-N-acetylglucosamine acyltransferase
MSIHPSSVISKEAKIGKDVVIGPFCVVAGQTTVGDGCVLESHVSLGSEFGVTVVGRKNRFSAGAAVGGPPQDLKYKGEPTQLVIGDNNVIREMATINIGTPTGGGVTKIGNDNLIMSYVHIAHDCILGDHVVIANSTQLAGHVILEDHVKVSGMCGISQFVRVGKYAYIAGDSAVNKDILPYTIAQGKYAVMRATNRIGLERAGFEKEDIESINRAVRIITKGTDTVEESLERISKECTMSPGLTYFLDFLKASEKGVAK